MLQNGQIEFGIIKGSATLLNPKAEKKPAEVGLVFEQGYRVETAVGSTSELLLSNGATLVLSPNTALEVRTFRQVGSDLIKPGQYRLLDKEPSPSVTEVIVKRGKITGEVRKLNPQSTFTIKTPVGVARVRGTIYTVEYAQNTSLGVGNIKVSVVRGLVEVTMNGANTGPSSLTTGRQMSAQGPVDTTKDLVQSVKTGVAVTNSTQLPKVEGAATILSVGDEIASPGVPKGTKVVAIDAEGNVTLSKSVSLPADAEIVVVVPGSADVVTSTVAVSNSNKLPPMDNQSAVAVGDVIVGPGVPTGTVVTGIDNQGNITLSNPVTIEAGTPLVAATSVPPEVNQFDAIRSTQNVVNSTTVPSVENHSSLSVGDVVTGAGIPPGTKVTAVDDQGNITLSNPVTLVAGAGIDIKPPDVPPPVVAVTVSVTNMNSDQIGAVASTLASGSSLPRQTVAVVTELAATAPPPPPLNVVDPNTSTGGGTTTGGSTDTSGGTTGGGTAPDGGSGAGTSPGTDTGSGGTTDTGTTTTGGGTSTGGGSSPLDQVTDSIQKVIEKEQQQINPSPAGG